MSFRGGDASALRAYNERLILDAIRQRGPLSKAELARATGLSAQAAAVISRGLLAEGMLVENDKVRGRVGQPMTPLALNPRGAFAVGVKIGRRGVDAALVDFNGAPLSIWRAPHDAPLLGPSMARAVEGASAALAALPARERGRVVGLGVAAPGHVHLWAAELGLASDALADWAGFDPAAALADALGLPAQLYNDATAACAAEMALGAGRLRGDALYIYLGAFVGGGVVIDGRLQHGARGNAGAVGSVPSHRAGPDGRPRQLIHDASLVFLEASLARAGVPPRASIAGEVQSAEADAAFADWAEGAAEALARCAAAAAALIDAGRVVIDGMLNPRWRDAMVAVTARRLKALDLSGLNSIEVVAGSLGADARMLGAALLPLHARFSPQPELLARESAEPAAAQ
ncbi:MAG: ROK family transcriptional regulator [Rubrimonas sp.]|uniref:ROK family transcriptional regulator n=1 Tax=Rubrimonas sp. TaxID=2036015 RepID=UPI002FDEC857